MIMVSGVNFVVVVNLKNFLMFIYFWKTERERERERASRGGAEREGDTES